MTNLEFGLFPDPANFIGEQPGDEKEDSQTETGVEIHHDWGQKPGEHHDVQEGGQKQEGVIR